MLDNKSQLGLQSLKREENADHQMNNDKRQNDQEDQLLDYFQSNAQE